MISTGGPGVAGRVRSRTGPATDAAWLAICGIVAGGLVVYLVSSGRWHLALGLLLVGPALILLHRYPFATLTVWLVAAPLVAVTDSGSIRKVFWLVHRGLPVATLGVIVLASVLGIRGRRLGRAGWPEIMMAGYLMVTLLSIGYTSDDVLATAIVLYDRVFIPMCLYLIVRLVEPDEADLKQLIPAVAFILLSQSALGLLGWVAPSLLPSEWSGKLGARTSGSLRNADMFGFTILFCGLFILHGGLTLGRRLASRLGAALLFALALVMVFLTFSRATWLATLVVLAGLLYVYPRFVKRFIAIAAPVIVLVLALGFVTQQVEFASQRLRSQKSEATALSRLPVVYAAVRMFAARPVAGWGYENFDRFDRAFQSRVGNLVYPEKDHSLHNAYLTILAEQGIVGFALFLGPLFYWLLRTRRTLGDLPASGFLSRKLVMILWLAIAAYAVVSNFVPVHITFGLGLHWLTLGLIGSLVGRSTIGARRVEHESRDAEFAGSSPGSAPGGQA